MTDKPTKIVFVTGGARSGKSTFALRLAMQHRRRVFLATAEPFDIEMQRRIGRHREERGSAFKTIEEPVQIARALKNVPEETDVVLLDCLTVWTGNLMHRFGDDEPAISAEIDALLEVLLQPPCSLVIVTNETGMGIVPENAMARRFRDMAGIINQRVASRSDEAWLLASGLPLKLK
ncbi:MAG: adenosylcobinamide kinase/adenosylcobinamide phosphate guanyltransferase [Pelodictyon luteolum]|uniref:Adenosylcobinamide kinase n=2 Tax=Pelodictyon luteolum TaxID=1100 RepID=Q3B3T6_CHLL3|nr:bifunctional adenosylcobinamide kinase/adenosylcobinamide-phosphate guanylyltransferase [Pelodictyon luteolum]ABB23995.1 adenosylcobinamide kinase [Pelodictyon luteolum DSM 273]KZK75155.1 MAG: adenosylcobinamide kinase/adenosylcobinamide phosphate guanyltransferase [Pelodictyon luteolum]